MLFGAVGDWKYDSLPREFRPEQAILGLRKALGLFANLRPAILYPELASASSLARDRVRPGHPHHPRADRRHLFRHAARRARLA